MKTCSKCGECKALECFGKCKGYAGGRRAACNECRRAEAREYNRTAAAKAAQVRFREAHPKPPKVAKPPKPPKEPKAKRKKLTTPEERLKNRREWYAQRVGSGYFKAYFAKNPSYRSEKQKRWYRKNFANATDPYVRKNLLRLGVDADLITPELISLKRESLLLKRLGKQIKEAINQPQEEP